MGKFKLAKGVRDIPPEEKIIKNKIVDLISKTFELYGFSPLETPIIERYETLTAKSGAGEESDALKETFKLTDQGKRKLALRFELTTSLARYIALNPNLKLPFKRYEVGPNFRDGPIKLGRERQFWQCDADTIGAKSMLAEAEQITILDSVFKKLNFKFEIKINNRKLLNGILNQAGIKEQKEAIISIDKLDKIGEKGVTEELLKKGYSKSQAKKVFKILDNKRLKDLKRIITNEEGKQGISELEQLFSYLNEFDIKSFVFAPSLARGQAYYTGTILEAFFTKSKSGITSSIASGGRYDDMVSGFVGGGRIVPAVGISFGLTSIVEEIKQNIKKEIKTPTKVLVIPIKTQEQGLKIVQKLRLNKVNSEISLIDKGITKSLQYANSLKIPYCIIVGEKELSKNKLIFRDMETGEEKNTTFDKIIKLIQKSA